MLMYYEVSVYFSFDFQNMDNLNILQKCEFQYVVFTRYSLQ